MAVNSDKLEDLSKSRINRSQSSIIVLEEPRMADNLETHYMELVSGVSSLIQSLKLPPHQFHSKHHGTYTQRCTYHELRVHLTLYLPYISPCSSISASLPWHKTPVWVSRHLTRFVRVRSHWKIYQQA